MNRFTKLAGFGLMASLFFASCEKDEDRVVIQPGSELALNASTTSAVLEQDQAKATAVTYSWSPVSFGYQAAVSYTLQFDKKGGDFSKPIEVEAGANTKLNLTVEELNSVLIRLKMAPGTAGEAQARVKASVGKMTEPVLSSTSTITGTPYLVFIQYPSIWVPGSYQGWDPASASFLASVNNDKQYEGYLYFPDATTNFKFTPEPKWGVDYGAGNTPGSIMSPSDKNLEVTGAGYYRVQVNLNTLTFTTFKTDWGLIGSATPGDWTTDTPLVYDSGLKVWKATVKLGVGELKFRSNRDWAPNPEFGDKAPVDGIPDYGGSNIKIAEAGTYDVVLDLSKGEGNYSYSITKQ